MKYASRGDAGLLVLELPAEFAQGDEPIQTFALPILSRAGGLLLAVPQNAIDENLLIAGMQPDGDSLVGPNKMMEAPLFEEEEGGTILTVRNACKFFLVDFNDEVLNFLHEYDSITDDVETILPFDKDFKYAIIAVEGLADRAREWAGSAGSRAAFYSAREDLSPSAKAAAPKKQKKPTNCLDGDVRVAAGSGFCPRCDCRSRKGASTCHSCRRAIQWTYASYPKDAKSRRCTEAIQSGSRNSCGSARGDGGSSSEDSYPCSSISSSICSWWYGRRRAKRSLRDNRPSGEGHSSTRICPHRTGGSPDLGCGWGPPSTIFLFELLHPRCPEAGEDDDRACHREQPVLLPVPATTPSQASPCGTSASECRRAGGLSGFPVGVPGEVWRVQGPEDPRHDYVAARPLHGLSSPWRHEVVSGTSGFDGGLAGASWCGSGRLVFGLPSESGVGASLDSLSREAAAGSDVLEGLRIVDTCRMVSNKPSLPQGTRSPHDQEDGDGKEGEGAGKDRGEPYFSQEEAQIPQEAQRGRGGMTVRLRSYSACRRAGKHCNDFAAGASPMKVQAGRREPFGIHSFEGGPESPDFMLDHPKWCSMLLVLRSRTSFAAYLARSFRPVQTASQSAPTVFPLPVPDPRCPFDRMPPGLSSSKRRRLHLGRALHVMCMALNYWHSGGDFADLEMIGRPSTSTHRRLKALLLSDVQFPASSMVRAGRRFPQLLARLGELSEYITYSGITSQPYSKDYDGAVIHKKTDLLPGLDPYRKADPSRIKISGEGNWDITDLLPDELSMVYREPIVIFNNREVPEGSFPHMTENAEEVAALAKLWDAHGLLHLHNFNVPDFDSQRLVRIFGAVKDESRDRQIGDRRGMNYKEDRVLGPSSFLPNGSDLTDLMVDLAKQRIHVAACDRKDFYHQIWVTKRRAVTNSLGPGVPIKMLEGTSALNSYLLQHASKKRRQDRREVGDHLHHGAGLLLPEFGDSRLCVSFKSILQGDHAGVEMACASHSQLLKTAGLLPPGEELVANRPLESNVKAQGLVIDDYFSISVDQIGSRHSSSSLDFATAKAAYKASNLMGSDDKDVADSSHSKVIGAEINGGRWALQNGLTTVASPALKRYSLSWVSLLVAAMPLTTDHLHLSLLGGWTSSMTFRRPCMGLFSSVYDLVKLENYSPTSSRTLELPRRVAEELTLAAVLCPLMVADISTPLHSHVFATDASEKRGAVLTAEIDPLINEALFKSFKTKGSYTRLQSPEEVLTHRLEISEAFEDEQAASSSKVDRPMAFRFDFLELFSGASKITMCMGALGVSTGVPIELSLSEEFNLKWPHLISWVFYLISNRLIKGLMVEPPCTTFSIMRRPALRDRDFPFGFDVEDPQTIDGNILAHRGLQLLWMCGYY